MVSENYPLEVNAQILPFKALMSALKSYCWSFLNMDKSLDIFERIFCGKIKMKYCFGCISVGSGDGGPLILGSEFENIGHSLCEKISVSASF